MAHFKKNGYFKHITTPTLQSLTCLVGGIFTLKFYINVIFYKRDIINIDIPIHIFHFIAYEDRGNIFHFCLCTYVIEKISQVWFQVSSWEKSIKNQSLTIRRQQKKTNDFFDQL